MRSGNIVSPWDLVDFFEDHLGMSNRDASNAISVITPECEVKTRDFDYGSVEARIEELKAAGRSPESSSMRAYVGVLAYMDHHDETEFTLTQ